MNYNQQTKGYKCNDCLKLFSASEVKRYCLDNDHLGVKMYCVLCSPCIDNQFWSKKQLGFFPLLANYLRNQEIKTPDFTKHEEDEKKLWGLFKCDKCSQMIPLTQEKEYEVIRYKPNTSIVSHIRYCLLCPLCWGGLKGSINYLIFDWKEVEVEKGVPPTFKTPTFIKYEEYKEQLKRDYENRKTFQEYLKKEQEK